MLHALGAPFLGANLVMLIVPDTPVFSSFSSQLLFIISIVFFSGVGVTNTQKLVKFNIKTYLFPVFNKHQGIFPISNSTAIVLS